MVCQFFLEKQTIFTMQETAWPTFTDNKIQTLIQSASWTWVCSTAKVYDSYAQSNWHNCITLYDMNNIIAQQLRQERTSQRWRFLAAAAGLHLLLVFLESITRSQCNAPHKSAKHRPWPWLKTLSIKCLAFKPVLWSFITLWLEEQKWREEFGFRLGHKNSVSKVLGYCFWISVGRNSK